MYDIVIVGAGPAGLTAALYARRAGHSVLVLEGGVPGRQAVTTPHVENWPGTLSISGPDFAMGLYQQCADLGAQFQFSSVTGFEDRGDVKAVRAGEEVYEGRTLILANGVRRRKLEVPGEDRLGGKGVSYCATCDGSFFKGREVAVVGGGNTAVEDAIYLASICPTVWLIHRRDRLTAQKYLVDNLKTKDNVKHRPQGAGDPGGQAGGGHPAHGAGAPAHPPRLRRLRRGGTHPRQPGVLAPPGPQ